MCGNHRRTCTAGSSMCARPEERDGGWNVERTGERLRGKNNGLVFQCEVNLLSVCQKHRNTNKPFVSNLLFEAQYRRRAVTCLY